MKTSEIESLQLYYFTGTGNARRITQWACEVAKNAGIPTIATNIEKLPQAPVPDSRQLVGFIYPVHGFTTIWAMLRFVLLFPKNTNDASVFTVTTLGGCKLGRYRIPGWEGSGLYLPLLILRLKGYRWAGACPMRYTPENWTALLPGYGETSSRYILEACPPRLTAFLDSILAGRRKLEGVFSAFIGFAILKISIMYLLVFRFLLAKTNFYSSGCNGCGTCAELCPVSAIEMRNERPYWKLGCESCMRCMNYCPQKAVQGHLPFGFLIMALLVSPLAEKLAQLFAQSVTANKTLVWLTSYATILVSLAAIYWVWFQLLRVRWINRLFEYTAPTRYWHRYREPDTTLKDIRSSEIS